MEMLFHEYRMREIEKARKEQKITITSRPWSAYDLVVIGTWHCHTAYPDYAIHDYKSRKGCDTRICRECKCKIYYLDAKGHEGYAYCPDCYDQEQHLYWEGRDKARRMGY